MVRSELVTVRVLWIRGSWTCSPAPQPKAGSKPAAGSEAGSSPGLCGLRGYGAGTILLAAGQKQHKNQAKSDEFFHNASIIL